MDKEGRDSQSLHLLSSEVSIGSREAPVGLHENSPPARFRRRSIAASIDSNLSFYSTAQIYQDKTPDEILLIRTQSRATILQTLSNRLDEPDAYKDVPDISVPTKDYGKEFEDIDPELVVWGDNDPEDPRNWSPSLKLVQVAVVSFYTLISPMSSSVSSPASGAIAEEFGITNSTIKALSVSIMILAFAIGPLIIAPLSESDKIGRRPVLNLSIWIIAFFNLGCGFCQNIALLCILRFLGGLGGCAALNVGAGTLADLYDNKTRIYAMAVYSICPSLGPVISPIVSGFVVQNTLWRWCFWVISIFNFVVAILGTIFLKETYSPTLLYKKAKKLREQTGNENLHTIFEITAKVSKVQLIKHTMLRPIKLLTYHPMVIGLGSFMAFTYGFMYLMLVTFPAVFQGSYGWSVEIAGLMFVPMGLGYLVGTYVWTVIIQKIYNELTRRNGGVPKPEYRLPCLVCSGIGLPAGLIIYGWSVHFKTHWIVPSIGTCIFAFSFIAVFQTIQNYLIDMNPRFAASSIAAAAVFRSLFGFGFPLFANAMYSRLGYGWGNTMCGLIAFALGVPFPLMCFKYGERLRLWADRRTERDQARFDEQAFKE